MDTNTIVMICLSMFFIYVLISRYIKIWPWISRENGHAATISKNQYAKRGLVLHTGQQCHNNNQCGNKSHCVDMNNLAINNGNEMCMEGPCSCELDISIPQLEIGSRCHLPGSFGCIGDGVCKGTGTEMFCG